MYEEIGQHLIPWLRGGWAPPFRVHLFPTDRCNLQCHSCWRWAVNPEGKIPWVEQELSEERILKIIDEAGQLGVREFEISGGGEPLLRKETTIAMAKKIKALGLKGCMTTNATLFNYDDIKLFVDIGWDQIIVSLDGPNADINDSLRPPKGTFTKVINNLDLFCKYKKLAQTNLPEIIIQCVLSKPNIRHILPMLELGDTYGAAHVGFEILKVLSYRGTDLALDGTEDFKIIENQMPKIKDFLNQHKVRTNIINFNLYPQLIEKAGNLSQFLTSFNTSKTEQAGEPPLLSVCCYEPWSRILVGSIGDCAPCCLAKYSYEDNLKEKSLQEVWLGKNFSDFRNKILTNKLPASCANCHVTLFAHSRSIQEKLKEAWTRKESNENGKLCSVVALRKNGQKVDKVVKYLSICLVSREYPPDTAWGGIGTYSYNLAQGLAAAGQNVHVICQGLDVDKEYEDNGVYVHQVAHKTNFPFKGIFREFLLRWEYSQSIYDKLKEVIKKHHIDIIEAPNLSAEGFIYSLHKKTPLVTRLHTHFSEVINFLSWEKTMDRRLSCWLENAGIARSDLVICSTNAHARFVAHEVGIPLEKIGIVPLGIPLPDLNGHVKYNAEPTVLFVGRLEKRKGVHILIQAIPYAVNKFPNARFIIVGRDSFIDDASVSFSGDAKHSFKKQLIAMLPEYCRKNVEFVGYVPPEDLSRYYRECDVFVAPSLYESFGLIYVEAMSYAKPVIGCGVGGVPEVIKDGVTGVLVPPADIEKLANAIIYLLEDKSRAEIMGKSARRHVEDYFSQEIMVENTLEMYSRSLKA
ncbi:MAG: glycosyltransferase [Candidatus Omnitrophota bacterium]|jgi:glycosyltransferase involved in cell wall biosynthesis/MoaA/NifB/PqqE/SkfB family radical SAM enzyme